MQTTSVHGMLILVAEDEPLIAIDIADAFACAGASVALTSTLQEALIIAERDGLSAAVIDHILLDGDSSPLCERLKERTVPFVVYSGFVQTEGPCATAPQVTKPKSPELLVSLVVELLAAAPPARACP
jgi:DNA-binding response OmpR family regulator